MATLDNQQFSPKSMEAIMKDLENAIQNSYLSEFEEFVKSEVCTLFFKHISLLFHF